MFIFIGWIICDSGWSDLVNDWFGLLFIWWCSAITCLLNFQDGWSIILYIIATFLDGVVPDDDRDGDPIVAVDDAICVNLC